MKVSLLLALSRSVFKKCPQCGEEKIYKQYLKLKSHCNNCNEKLSIYRTDDFGPWLTIIIVGHIIVPLVLYRTKLFTSVMVASNYMDTNYNTDSTLYASDIKKYMSGYIVELKG